MRQLALITGATSGIGLEFAEIFAQEGTDLILVARGADSLSTQKQELEDKYRVQVTILPADLTLPDDLRRLTSFIADTKRLDFVVNNAGFGDFGYFSEREYPKMDNMICLNINALTEITHFAVRKMLSQSTGGKILNIASIAGLQPVPYMAVYAATKAFVLSLSEALHYELRSTKVSLTALLPGPTDTRFFQRGECEGSRMRDFSMNPADVARVGYNALMKGKMKVIAGRKNRFLGGLAKLLPINNFTLRIAEFIAKEK